MGGRRKRHLKTAGILTVIFALSAGSLWYFIIRRSDHNEIEDQVLQNDNIVTATGMTEMGKDTVTFAIDFLEDTCLCVEEVYLSDGDTAGAGEKCIKFTDDSIDKARKELEKAVQKADLAYRSRVLSNGEAQIQAKNVYDMAVLEAKYAPQIYQDTLTQLEMQLIKAEKACEDAQKEYNAYYLRVVNNTFYEDYQVEKLKKAYEDAYDLYASRGAYWEVTQEELSMLSGSGNDVREGQSDRQWVIRTVALLKDEMTEAKAEYEQARQDYEREIEGAGLKLQKLLNQFERTQQDLIDAQTEHQKGSFRAKTAYELAVAKGQTAENDYNVCLISLADELERLKEEKDEAVRNKELFEELAGDGYLYTERSGTIAMMQAGTGEELVGGSLVLAYENPEEISVSMAVPGADLEKLSVGERARAMIADRGSFDGVVETIYPITSSENKASGYGIVVVSLTDDASVISPDLTAEVVFGEDAQDDIIQCSVDGCRTAKRGMASQMYDLDMYDLDVLAETDDGQTKYLKVAETYIEAGQHIREGDPVCRFTQDSVENIRKALVHAQAKARIALMESQTEYHIGVLEAGLSHNEAMIDKMLAQTVYDNTVARLNSSRVEMILETEQLLADIYQLQTALTDDDYQKQRADITRAYDRAKKQLVNAKESFVTSQTEAAQNFQAAKDAYEDFFSQFDDTNQEIEDKVEQVYAIQDKILQSQQLLEKALVTAEQARCSAETAGEIANAKYEGILKEYENALNKAQSHLEQVTRELDDFDQFIGEGIVYATQDGLVTEVGGRKGDCLVDVRNLVSFVADADADLMSGTGGKEDAQ